MQVSVDARGTAPPTRRDVAFELRFLTAASRGRAESWVNAVLDRVAAHDGPDSYGESYRWASLAHLLTEIELETFDLGGYAALIAGEPRRPPGSDGRAVRTSPLTPRTHRSARRRGGGGRSRRKACSRPPGERLVNAAEHLAPVVPIRAEDRPHPRTDQGNAERLIALHGEGMLYVSGVGWHTWNGICWDPDDTGAVMRLAKATARQIYAEAASATDDEERKHLGRWAAQSEAEPRLRAMVTLAQTEQAVIARATELDADPWKLTVANGTIDLRTGHLWPWDPADRITKASPIIFDPDARHPAWERFLEQATGGDHELSDYLQRAVGYSLTGETSEEVLFFPWGPSATGKSTFIVAVQAALGEHAVTADFDTFLQRRGDAGVRNDIARLAGRRMVVSQEVDEGKRLAEGLLKTLTGGDVVTARYLHREFFEFTPRFKLWLVANARQRCQRSLKFPTPDR